MQMKITNEEIMETLIGLQNLEELDMPLDVKTSYYLAKDRKTLMQLGNIISRQRLEIFKKYGEETKPGEFTVPNEKTEILQSDLEKLFNITNEVVIDKVSLEDFGDNKIPFYVMEKILPLIKD